MNEPAPENLRAVARLMQALRESDEITPTQLECVRLRQTIGRISVVARVQFPLSSEDDLPEWLLVNRIRDAARTCDFVTRYLHDLSDKPKGRAFIVFDDQHWIG